MDIPIVDINSLIHTCAPDIGANTMKRIIQVESTNNPWIVNDNRTKKSYILKTKNEAVEKAKELYKQGNSIDLGLAQINSKNLTSLNLTIEQVMEPCTNLKAGATILKNFYLKAKTTFADEQQALFHALSAYNTGSFYKGCKYASIITNKPAFNEINISPQQAPILVSWNVKNNF